MAPAVWGSGAGQAGSGSWLPLATLGRLWRRPWTRDKAQDEPSPPPCLPLPGRPRRAAPQGLALRVPGACLADRPPPAPTEQTLMLTLTLTTGGDRQRRRPAPLGKPSVDHVRGCMGGSVVEFSPATREARVRFPANAARLFCLFLAGFPSHRDPAGEHSLLNHADLQQLRVL